MSYNTRHSIWLNKPNDNGKLMKKLHLSPSGISFIDEAWGGFYKGGTYLLIGPKKSCRTFFSLQYARECVNKQETCLYFTTRRPKDLMINAASIDFDLQNYMNQNLIVIIRVSNPMEIEEVKEMDEYLTEYLNDIITVVEQYQPKKIVFDELTPFIGFNNINLLGKVFLRTVEAIEEKNITSLFILSEPVTPAAELIVDTLSRFTTGIISMKKEDDTNGIMRGKITITPNVGHTEGSFQANYHVEPYKGLVIDFQSEQESAESVKKTNNKSSDKYRPIAEIQTPSEKFSYSNFYSTDDFYLILNTQIAYYKSTGQVFTLVSFRLDPEAERLGLLTLNQLKNAIRLSADKKDKICELNGNVIVLMTGNGEKSAGKLISLIKQNLPGTSEDYIQKVIQYISVYIHQVDNSINNAQDLLLFMESK
jgi:KaiC/GvpD/RAD55 family RecA-like ATPase